MEAVFRQEVATLRAQDATVLLSSHILSEVEHLCDRVSIIRSGRTVESGTLAELRHLTRTEVSFASAGIDRTALAGIPGAHRSGRGCRPGALHRRLGCAASHSRCPGRTASGRSHHQPAEPSRSCSSGTIMMTPRPTRRRRRRERDPHERTRRAAAAGACVRDRIQLLVWVIGFAVLASRRPLGGRAELRQRAGSRRRHHAARADAECARAARNAAGHPERCLPVHAAVRVPRRDDRLDGHVPRRSPQSRRRGGGAGLSSSSRRRPLASRRSWRPSSRA